MFKIVRKASTLVLLILIIASCFLLPLFVKLTQDTFFDGMMYSYDERSPEDQKSEVTSRIEEIEKDLTSLESSPGNDEYIIQLQTEKEGLLTQLENLNYMIDNGITGRDKNGFIYDSVTQVRLLQNALIELNSLDDKNRPSDWTEKKEFCEDSIDLLHSLVKTKDFRAYLDFKTRSFELKLFVPMSDTDVKLLAEMNDLWYQFDPSGGTDGKYNYTDVESALWNYYDLKSQLYNGVSSKETMEGTKYTALSPDEKERLEDKVAVLESRIKEHSLALPSKAPMAPTAKSVTLGFGQFLITLLILVIAGSTISQEISTGSIKSLIIAPVKRWKIYTAKLLSLLSMGIVLIVILCLFSNIGSAIFFGTDLMVPYFYASGSSVASMPYLLYDLLNLFASNVSILVYGTLAFMLSIITRNTALSVGASMATFFTTSAASDIIRSLPIPHQLWMDFLPFMNFDLAVDLFPFSSFMQPVDFAMNMGDWAMIRPGLQFTLIYLAVLIFCMLYTGFDSFTRSDIK